MRKVLFVAVDQLDALLREASSPDCGQQQLGSDASQCGRYARGVEVTGSLSGDEQHLTHGGAYALPAKEEFARFP